MDREADRKLAEQTGSESYGQQHEVQLEASHERCTPCVDSGAKAL